MAVTEKVSECEGVVSLSLSQGTLPIWSPHAGDDNCFPASSTRVGARV